jgi:hypothetical protein
LYWLGYPVLHVRLKSLISLVDVEANQTGVGNCVYKEAHTHARVCRRRVVTVVVAVVVVVIVVFNNNAASAPACKDAG